MKPVALIALAAACCFAQAATAPASSPAPSADAAPAPAAPGGAATAAAPASAGAPVAAAAGAPAVAEGAGLAASAAVAPAAPAETTPAPALPRVAAPAAAAGGSAAGSLLQTILALSFVLALLGALAWGMKRYGPKAPGGNTRLRLLSSLSLGGRERIMLIEVADQWIVVGASPGRVNALATMPRQEDDGATAPGQTNGPAAANFSEWLKQTIEKRNGK